MARKLCIVCNTRPGMNAEQRRNQGVGIDFSDQCEACYVYAGWENTHSDDAHDAVAAGDTDGFSGGQATIDRIREEMKDCPVCLGNDPANDTPRTGHTNTRAHSYNSHAGHGHATSAADRRICRRVIAATGNAWDGNAKTAR